MRLTRPGMSAASRNPFAGFSALGFTSDDEDDPAFTGGGGEGGSRRNLEDDDSEEDDDEDEEEQPKSSKKSKTKDENGDREPTRPERQAARYRVALREAEAREKALEERLRKIEDSDKPTDEIVARDLKETRDKLEALTEVNRVMSAQLAFFKANTIEWVDPSDAFALAERAGMFDDLIDEDGNVDTRELQRSLRDLAKQKPHLVKKSRAQVEDKGDDDKDEDVPRSGSTMNGNRKGSRQAKPDRASLAKRFPVLGR